MSRPDLLRLQSARLRELRQSPPTPETVATAIDALSSKHEGLRSLGAALLGQWGLPEFVEPLRAVILQLHESRTAYGLRRVVLRALERCAGASDADWVASYIFDKPAAAGSINAIYLLRSLPWPSWFGRVRSECSHPDPKRRRLAALVLSFSAVPVSEQFPVLQQLRRDTDENVRALARLQLERLQESRRV